MCACAAAWNCRGKTFIAAVSLCLLSLTGCFPVKGKDGTTRHVVLGLGVISVKQAPNRAMVVTDSHVLGMHVSDQPGLKMGMGWSQSTVTEVADGAEDVRAEVRKSPGAPLVVEVQSATLKKGTALYRQQPPERKALPTPEANPDRTEPRAEVIEVATKAELIDLNEIEEEKKLQAEVINLEEPNPPEKRRELIPTAR